MEVNKDRLVKTFIGLVKINSESGEEQEIIKYLQEIMINFGFSAEIDQAGNLICSNDSNPKLMLAAHTDTVKPGKNIQPIIEGNVIKTDGTTILGGDNKANIAIILEILTLCKENNVKIPLEIIFTVSEEIGLVGSKNLDYSKIKSKIGLNLDGETGEIDLAETSIVVIDIKVMGKAAHSGICPEQGINALKIAADAINVLNLGKIDHETTVNFGTIQGGSAVNAIPAEVKIQGEVRSMNEEKLNFQVNNIIDVFEKSSKKYGGTVEINHKRISHACKVSESDELVRVLKNSSIKNGVEPELVEIMATSDANHFSKNGIKCVTCGGVGKKYHTTEEYLEIDKFMLGAVCILDAVLKLAK